MASESYTTHDVARFCGVTMPGVIRWINQGKLKAHKTPGGHRRIGRQDLIEFMKQYGVPLPQEMEGSAKPKVLVVDDEASVRYMAVRTLSRMKEGLELQTAEDGFEAGRKIEAFSPDVVLLDLRLPGIDGFKVCQSIKTDPKRSGIKVLAMTGMNTKQMREKIMACGADGYLAKPFDAVQLEKETLRLLKK